MLRSIAQMKVAYHGQTSRTSLKQIELQINAGMYTYIHTYIRRANEGSISWTDITNKLKATPNSTYQCRTYTYIHTYIHRPEERRGHASVNTYMHTDMHTYVQEDIISESF